MTKSMIYISSKKIFLTISAILFVAILAVLGRSWAFPDTSWIVDKGEKAKISEAGITETFATSRDGLSQIRILFGNSRVKDGGTLHLDILDAPSCTDTLRSSEIHVSSLGSDDTVNFRFARIPDSAGKTYCLRLTYRTDKGTGSAIVFVTEAAGPAEHSRLVIDGEERPGQSLSMRPAYRNASFFSDLRELTERISQYKPWFGKGAIIAIVGILSILLALGIVVIVILA